MFSPRLGPILPLYGLVQANRGKRLTFGQTSQLRQETWLISSKYT